jgi:hypothetical protein
MHAIDTELIHRLADAFRRASATSRELMHEIQRAGVWVSRCSATLTGVRAPSEFYPDRPPRGLTRGELAERSNRAAIARMEAETRFRGSLRAAGITTGQAAALAQLDQPTEIDFQQAVVEAEATYGVPRPSKTPMANPMGEAGREALRLNFDCRLMLGSAALRSPSYGGLLA